MGIWKRLARAPIGVWGGSLIYHAATRTLHLLGGYRDSFNPVVLTDYPVYKYYIDSDVWFSTAVRQPSFERVYASADLFLNDTIISFGGIKVPFDATTISNDCFYSQLATYDLSEFFLSIISSLL